MKKIIALLIVGITITGCSRSNGDVYLGKWSNVKYHNMILEVTKHDGGNGYTVSRYTDKANVIESYSGVDDGKTININVLSGVIPMEIKGSQLSFTIMDNCYEANCSLWNKVSN